MAKTILTDVSIVVNGVTLSDHANKVTISSKKDLVEVTSFGASYKSNLLGLGDASIAVDFFQDYAASSIDATLWPLHAAGTVFTVVIMPTSSGVSATNPSYTMSAVLPEFDPLDGKIGDASMASVTFQNAGQTGIVKATS